MTGHSAFEPSADASLCLRRQLCFTLYATSNRLTRLYRPLLEPLGLTYPQYLVMLVLWENGPCHLRMIGEQLMLDSGTLTPLLKRMQTNGLVTRTRDPGDERCVRITLTRDGEALKPRALGIPQLMCAKLNLPASQLDALRTQLQVLLAALPTTGS